MSKKQVREELESIFRQWKTLNNAPNAKTAIRMLFEKALTQVYQEGYEEALTKNEENNLDE